MKRRIYYKVPYADEALVPIGEYLVVVLFLIGDKLMEFATFEFNLFLIKLVFYHERST